ncbi:MAG: SDR family oxidoreductase [Gammaproteobacteria bacterium]|nr:SDR family oxidoreductase [Gammaproteobacteria bacterium]
MGKKVANKIIHDGGKAQAIACDVTQDIECKNLVERVIVKYGRIDILVNNVGLAIFKPFDEHTLEDWDFTFNTNIKSAFILTRAVVPHMKHQHYGKIIFVSSTAANIGFATLSAYSATKGAMQALVRVMVSELAQYNININLLSPGSTDTPGNSVFVNDPVISERIKNNTPTKTGFMVAKDLAGPAIFLASDEAKAVHGLDLIVDNGVSVVSI